MVASLTTSNSIEYAVLANTHCMAWSRTSKGWVEWQRWKRIQIGRNGEKWLSLVVWMRLCYSKFKHHSIWIFHCPSPIPSLSPSLDQRQLIWIEYFSMCLALAFRGEVDWIVFGHGSGSAHNCVIVSINDSINHHWMLLCCVGMVSVMYRIARECLDNRN